jgi:hypothetical protein
MASRFLNIFIFTLFLGLFQSCSSSAINPDGYISYCNDEDNGLIQKREFDAIIYSLKYEPIEYKAISELTGEHKTITVQNFEKLKKEYNGLLYFVFKIENSNSEKSPIKSIARNQEDLSKLTQYCQSDLSKEFYLESGETKIPSVLFHIEDDYSLTNFNLISLAFDAKDIDLSNDIAFVYNDPFFKNGLLKFNISKESIKNIPKINI